jgi:Alginate export
MRFTCHRANGLARAGLAIGLSLLMSRTSAAQVPVNPEPPAPAATAESSPPATVEGCPAGEPQKPFWATNPPVTVFPPPGNFAPPPTGPGYYSAWDWIIGNYRDNPPKFPYGPISICPFPFFMADFRYLDDPTNTQEDWLDFTKRIHLGDCWLLSVGGEERFRYMNEVDSRLNKAGLDNTYELMRSRVYTDLWYGNVFRVYAELLAANIYNEDLAPAPIDQVRPTMLNLFADLKIFELDGSPVYLRGGRQELLYGSERLISPLDWANTLRTFEGVKGFWHTETLDVDAFWVQPVVLNPTDYHDGVDSKQNFEGLWLTCRPQKGQVFDLYYLNLDNDNKIARGEYGDVDGYNVSTVGTRYAGNSCNFLWDGEGMFQFGSWANQVIAAGAATIGGGYNFKNAPMNPTFWIYYDWAEGDPHPGVGNVHRTFNQLFPFGHYYFGGIDLVGRQNIDDLNLHLYFWPTKWIVTGVQFHVLHLDSPKDSLYNSGGTAILGTTLAGPAKAVNGEATDVGDELTLYTNFHLSAHQDIWLQYCKLYAGDFLTENKRGSPSLMAVQYSFRW